MSFSPLLNTGITRAIFKQEGKIPSLKAELNNVVRGIAITSAATTRKYAEILSWPEDLLFLRE